MAEASELAEMYLVRETLESAALAAAVVRATEDERAHVAHANQLLEDAVAEDDPQTYHRQSRIFHLGLARTYQIITLFPKDTLEHNVALSLLGLSRRRWSMFGRLPASFYADARAVLARVGLEKVAGRPIAEVAYGEKRRVEIAMALAQKPRVLLLDEPLAGLSREERAQVKSLIAAIPRETTVVMIEHDMDTALDLADRITVLHYGRVIVEGTRAEVVADPKTREVYLGH